MDQYDSSPTTYLVVLVALVLLTVLTMGVSFAPLAGGWHIAVGLSIAVVKGALVLLFFMQAIRSPRNTWAVIAVAISGLSLLLLLTYTDYVSRGMIPGMPDH